MPYTPPSSLRPKTSLAELGKALNDGFLAFAFQAEGQDFSLRIRRLTSAELDEANAHARALLPPVRTEYLAVLAEGEHRPGCDAKEAPGKACRCGAGRAVWDFDNPSTALKARIDERAKLAGWPDGQGGVVPLPFAQAALREKYDYVDKDYVASSALAEQRQAATILHYGCEGGLVGATPDEKVKTMRGLLPNTVIRLLVERLIEISSGGVIESASFFTPAG